MRIVNTLEGVNLDSWSSIASYWDSELIQRLYLLPKRVAPSVREAARSDASFLRQLEMTAAYASSCSLDLVCQRLLDGFVADTGHPLPEGSLYIVLGCATTTIYTVPLDGRDVSVLCIEAVCGSEDRLKLLLAHEYTHFVRKALLEKDILESCVGERLVTEGIAESYSKDVVPQMSDADCCIVDDATVAWVLDNEDHLAKTIAEGLETTDQMAYLFYMYAQIDIPVRTGYVYGYRAVRRYLVAHHLQTKDILGIDWHDVLEVGAPANGN